MIKIISWNLLRTTGASADDVVALVRREQPDVLLMQEATRAIDIITSRLGGDYTRTLLPGRIHGLAVWTPQKLARPPMTVLLPPGQMVQRVCQIIDLGAFSVANVHLSHGQLLNRRQLRRIAGKLPLHAAVLGDYNLVGPALLPGFRDVGPRQPTHKAVDMVPLRLDRCLVRGLVCTGARTLARQASDHRPILVHLEKSSGTVERKAFFFEKKKQKTFAGLLRVGAPGWPAAARETRPGIRAGLAGGGARNESIHGNSGGGDGRLERFNLLGWY